nr:hypothetical protein [Polymorphobacter sp.]
MTPEQEALADIQDNCRQLIAGVVTDWSEFATLFPIDEATVDAPTGPARHLFRSFSKSFEQVQDQVMRKLLRAVLLVATGGPVEGRKLDQILIDSAALIDLDIDQLRTITGIRNSLTHDYALSFRTIAPVLNQAWAALPDLLALAERIDRFVGDRRLLEAKP